MVKFGIMINPTLSRTTENQPELTADAKKIFQVIYRDEKKVKDGEEVSKIKVSSFLSKMAFYYEKIRNSIDYKEEHLLRKNAIERILRREIFIQGSIKKVNSDKVSKNLLTELIRAAYLPNDEIPESKISEIASVIEKYLVTKNGFENSAISDFKEKNATVNWIISMAACDIEERLRNNAVVDTAIEQMYKTLITNVKLPENSRYKDDLEIQVYSSIYRKFLKFDDWMIGFILFKYHVPAWSNADQPLIEKLSQNLINIRLKINEQVDHPLRASLNRLTSRYAVFFNVLIDVIGKDANESYKKAKLDYKDFAFDIKKTCEKNYSIARSKLWRAAIRSILYILITKSVFILAEIPISRWFGQEINSWALAINVGFPALLLFVIVLFTRVPNEDNTKKIVSGIEEILYDKGETRKPITLRTPVKRGSFMNSMFGVIYAVTFFSSFGVVIWALYKIHFNLISIGIFLFFLAFVSFFSIRIRKSINELRVLEPKESLLSFLVDFFYMPIVATGKYLSEKFSRVNVFVFIMDFIIEAPFKTFVEIAEEWAKYVKERREEIV